MNAPHCRFGVNSAIFALRGYQFRIVKASGEVLGTDDIFYSEEAALAEARCWLKQSER